MTEKRDVEWKLGQKTWIEKHNAEWKSESWQKLMTKYDDKTSGKSDLNCDGKEKRRNEKINQCDEWELELWNRVKN